MKNKMSVKFSSNFLLLAVGFLILFNPFVGKAQSNSSDCKSEFQYVYRYNGSNWYWTWDWVPVCLESGYQWVNPKDPKDFRVEPKKNNSISKNSNSTRNSEQSNNSSSSSNKYSAPVDSPILGTWKYQDGCTTTGFGGFTATSCNRTSTYIYSQDGNVQSIHIINLSPQTVIGNWKFTAEDKSSGVLEEFKDDKLVEKGNVKFLGKSQLQYTITFSGSPDIVGKTYIWNKQ